LPAPYPARPVQFCVIPFPIGFGGSFDPRQVDTEERAKREARMMADKYAGVVAWSREADPMIGQYGPPAGAVPSRRDTGGRKGGAAKSH